MACVSPLKGWRSKSVASTGRRGITFVRSEAFTDLRLEVPCGQCIGCRLERSRQWAVRIMHETQLHERASFLTLTYDDDHLPDDGSLRKKDLQLFCKRLRKRVGRFRYYACGEYGERTKRPHYHMVCFGYCPADGFPIREGANPLYYSAELEEIWGHGMTSFGAVSFESAAYVARYCVKKVTGRGAAEAYKSVDVRTGEVSSVLPEFSLMSLKPGVGLGWFDQFGSDVFPGDFVISRGNKASPPRYYFKKLEERDAEMAELVRSRRMEQFQAVRSEFTDDRLSVMGEFKRKSLLARVL